MAVLIELAPPSRGESEPSTKQISAVLRGVRDSVVGGLTLSAVPGHGGVYRWRVVPAGSDRGSGSHQTNQIPAADASLGGSGGFGGSTPADTQGERRSDELELALRSIS
jgi:hypothetical protein